MYNFTHLNFLIKKVGRYARTISLCNFIIIHENVFKSKRLHIYEMKKVKKTKVGISFQFYYFRKQLAINNPQHWNKFLVFVVDSQIDMAPLLTTVPTSSNSFI